MSLYSYRYSPNPILSGSLLTLLSIEGSYNLAGIVEDNKLAINNFFYIEMKSKVIGCIWFNHNKIENEIEISLGKLSNDNMSRGMLPNVLNDLHLFLTLLPMEWTDESLKPKWLIMIQNENVGLNYISSTINNYGFNGHLSPNQRAGDRF